MNRTRGMEIFIAAVRLSSSAFCFFWVRIRSDWISRLSAREIPSFLACLIIDMKFLKSSFGMLSFRVSKISSRLWPRFVFFSLFFISWFSWPF